MRLHYSTLTTQKIRMALCLLAAAAATATAHTPQDSLTLPRPGTAGKLQRISGDELTRIQDASFLNALTGRLPGVNVNQAASGMGGTGTVVWRGLKSYFNSNNMLYTVNGVPLMRMETEPTFLTDGAGQTGDNLLFLSPNDIEQIYVLSPEAASVLYGGKSANGILMIDTRRGSADGFSAQAGNSTLFTSSLVSPEFPRTGKYAAGNPTDIFFQTGHSINNHLSVAYGNEYNQTRFAAATSNNNAIVPNSGIDRYHLSLRNTSSLFRHRLKLDINLQYAHTTEQNLLSHGASCNPLMPMYLVPDVLNRDEHGDYEYIEHYERYDLDKDINVQFWPEDRYGLGMQNPYWIVNRIAFDRKKKRLLAGINAAYALTSWLDVRATLHHDSDDERGTQKYHASSTVSANGGWLMNATNSYNGAYYENDVHNKQLYSQLLFNARGQAGRFSANVQAGVDYERIKNEFANKGGYLRTANVFNLSNTSDPYARFTKNFDKLRTKTKNTAAFLWAQLDYNRWLQFDLGGRYEWTDYDLSDMGFFFRNFYPTGSLSLVPTEWMQTTSRDILSYLKLGYAYSENGNNPEVLQPLNPESSADKSQENRLMNIGWRTERSKTHEIRMDMAFLKGKIYMNATLYRTATEAYFRRNRIGISNGMVDILSFNHGKLENRGLELSVGTHLKWGSVGWNGRLTYATNKGKIKELEKGIDPATEQEYEIESIDWYSDSYCSLRMEKGKSPNELYAIDYQRDAQGNPEVTEMGYIMSTGTKTYMGNTNPKGMLGLENNFRWNGLELDFLIHARFGGKVLSFTQLYMDQHYTSKASNDALDQGGVWGNGNQVNASNYYLTKTPSMHVYDATNVRLAELSLSYRIPMYNWVGWMQEIRLSLVGRNLLMLYNKAPFDPETANSGNPWLQGIDFFRQPSYRELGFSVNLTF